MLMGMPLMAIITVVHLIFWSLLPVSGAPTMVGTEHAEEKTLPKAIPENVTFKTIQAVLKPFYFRRFHVSFPRFHVFLSNNEKEINFAYFEAISSNCKHV